MRKLHKLLPAVALAIATREAAGHILYEPFNYTAGDLTAGAVVGGAQTPTYSGQINPWGPAWTQTGSTATADNVQVIAGGHVGPQPWMTGVGNTSYVANAGNGSRIGIGPFVTPTGGAETVYYSLSLKVTETSQLGAATALTGTTVVAFNNLQDAQTNVPGIIANRLVLRRHASDVNLFQIGVAKKTDNATVWEKDGVGADLYRDVNTEYLVVGGYTMQGATDVAAADDEARIWVNPALASYGATEANRPTASAFSTSGTDIYSSAALVNTVRIESLVIQQRGAATTPLTAPIGIQADEIRVGTRWADVVPGAPAVWSGPSGGAWTGGPSWGGTAPNAAGAVATFPVSASPTSIALDADQIVGTLNFDSPQPYTIDPAVAQTLTLSGSPTIHVSDGTGHTVTAPVVVADDLTATVATGKSVALNNVTFAAGATLTKAGAGTLSVNRVRGDGIRMLGGTLKLLPDSGVNGVSVINALEMRDWTPAAANPVPNYTYDYTNPGKIDITNNKLIVHNGTFGVEAAGVYSGIQGLVQRASNGGLWNGKGITTSQAAAPTGLTSIGTATGAQLKGLSAGQTATFAGQTITDTSVVAMYTYAGDANMDGFISGDDYSAIDFNIAIVGADGWFNGDFNYDGIISGDDYSAIDFNIVAQGSPFFAGGVAGGVTAVPEPTSLGMLATGAALAATLRSARRRRVRKSG